MAALNFPSAPVDGQVFPAPNGILYRWDATAGLWLVWGTGTNNAIITPAPPVDPVSGQLWWTPALGQLFIYFVHETAGGAWVPATPSVGTPPGMISDFGGSVAPPTWFLCDGSLQSRSVDQALFAVIGETYGAGDGETTFALPDLRGRVTAMADGDAGRLPDWEIGLAGGEHSHTLSEYEMPSHVHGVADPGHAHGDYGHSHQAPGGRVAYVVSAGADTVIYSYHDGSNAIPYVAVGAAAIAASGVGVWLYGAGSSGPHNNVQPTMAVNKIIKR